MQKMKLLIGVFLMLFLFFTVASAAITSGLAVSQPGAVIIQPLPKIIIPDANAVKALQVLADYCDGPKLTGGEFPTYPAVGGTIATNNDKGVVTYIAVSEMTHNKNTNTLDGTGTVFSSDKVWQVPVASGIINTNPNSPFDPKQTTSVKISIDVTNALITYNGSNSVSLTYKNNVFTGYLGTNEAEVISLKKSSTLKKPA